MRTHSEPVPIDVEDIDPYRIILCMELIFLTIGRLEYERVSARPVPDHCIDISDFATVAHHYFGLLTDVLAQIVKLNLAALHKALPVALPVGLPVQMQFALLQVEQTLVIDPRKNSEYPLISCNNDSFF